MNWEGVIAISEAVGALAVVISVLYVGVQVRQNTKSQNALMHQQLLDSQTGANRGIVDNEEVSALIHRANTNFDALTPSENIQLSFVYFNFFNLWHSAYTNHKQKMLNDTIWAQWDRGHRWLYEHNLSARRVWSTLSEIYEPEFVRYVRETTTTGTAGLDDAPHNAMESDI